MRYEFLIEQVERFFELLFDVAMLAVNMAIAAFQYSIGRSPPRSDEEFRSKD